MKKGEVCRGKVPSGREREGEKREEGDGSQRRAEERERQRACLQKIGGPGLQEREQRSEMSKFRTADTIYTWLHVSSFEWFYVSRV